MTKKLEEGRFESHDFWIDIQYIRAGRERVDVLVTKDHLKESEHMVDNDCYFYEETAEVYPNQIYLEAGMLAVFYRDDIHKPGISIAESQEVEKVVFKIRA